MLTNDMRALIALSKDKQLCIRPEMINRHGLVTGATGTGKTVTLQTLAETFSALGVPVLMADVKGDLSGIALPGSLAGKPGQRVQELGLTALGFVNQGFPVCFWDVYGENGHPLRATVTDAGPLLLSRLLKLNETQAGVLQMIFRIADDNGLLLLDLKDLRSMAQHVNDERAEYSAKYGQVASATIGAIQRALLRLEEEGGDYFFGEPAMDINDFLRMRDGKGVVNVLDATRLVNAPGLYACVLLWLLAEIFERLPEKGDQPKPEFVIFFDEAHLMFADINPALLQKVEQVVRLVRSRGVGIYFVSQNPADMPDSILGQLGNRVQHALRAFTPKDQKAVRAAAQAFRANPAFSTEAAIGNLAVGEALVSFLDANGAPQMVEKALIAPPEGQIGPITAEERRTILQNSPMAGKYDQAIDRESAYEILAARAGWMQQAQVLQDQAKQEAKQRKAMEAEARQREREARRQAREQAQNDPLGTILGSVMRQTSRAVSNSVARQIGKSVFGTGIGGKIGTSIVRGILGSLMGKS